MKKLLNRLINEEGGQGMVEYGLIIVTIAVVVVAALWIFGDDVANIYNDISFER